MTEAKKTVKKPAPKTALKTTSKPVAKKETASAATGTVTVKQTGSPARSEDWAYQTLTGLGLGKMNRVRTLQDTPSVRGMIARVHHLVTVQKTA